MKGKLMALVWITTTYIQLSLFLLASGLTQLKSFMRNLALVHYFLSFLEIFFYQFGPKNGQNLPENARFLHGMRNTVLKNITCRFHFWKNILNE